MSTQFKLALFVRLINQVSDEKKVLMHNEPFACNFMRHTHTNYTILSSVILNKGPSSKKGRVKYNCHWTMMSIDNYSLKRQKNILII